MSNNINVLIVGAGNMAKEYAKVLNSLGIAPVIIGRSEKSAQEFYHQTGINVQVGGLQQWLSQNKISANTKVIIATPVEVLTENVKDLILHGVKDILVEKPGFLNEKEGQELLELVQKYRVNVRIAYNRRFYSSVIEAENIIQEDGGLKSIQFEFTEWAHVIAPLKKGEGVKEKWFLGNSTHVVDLVFYLGGLPKEFQFYTSGQLSWHPSACVFSGAGITEKGILFNYGSNWAAPGRWGIELMTNKHRLYLKPMEKLSIQNIGSLTVGDYQIDDNLDVKFKPGLYRMIKAFLEEDYSRFLDIESQLRMYEIYTQMANYKD